MRGVGIAGGSSNSGRPVIADKPARHIVDAGREQPDGIERPRIAFHADRRQQPVGRLDRGHAAERGRPDHRAAGLRSQRQRDHAGPHRRRRARRRSAGRMAVIVRIERRRRIDGGERRGRGLADDGRARLLQHHHDGRIAARPKAPVDRRAHLGREIRGIDDVLDADRNAAQRPGALRARACVMADEGADGLFLRIDRFQRLRDRGVGGKIAGIDAALEFGERDHEGVPVMSAQVTERLGIGASVTPITIKQVDRNLRLGKAAAACMTGRNSRPTSPRPSGSTGCG